MCGQSIEDTSQRLLGHFETAFDRVRAIHEHFRLDDRHQIPFLAKRRVTRQRLRVRIDAGVRGYYVADCDNGAPFGKARAQLPILHEPIAQPVEPFGDFLAGKICHRLSTLVHLDPRDDPLLFQGFYERATIASLLPDRFIKQDYAADEFTGAFGGEQNFPICAAVLLRRRDVDALQSLLNCPRTLIGCQDSFAWCDEFFCYRFQIFSFHNSFLKIPNEIIVLFLAKCSEKCKSKAAGCSVRCPQRTSRQNNRLATCCAKQSACYSAPEQHRHEQEQEVDLE